MHHGSISRSSPMVHVVFLILASGFLIMLCDASCSQLEPRRLRSGEILTGCEYNDTMREINSTWFAEDCKRCICFSDYSVICCTEINKLVPNDPGCVSVFNRTACSYELKRKDNSTTPCSIRGVM